MQTLAQDLSALWQAETTTHAERKQLLRLAIESVQLDGVSRPGWIEIQIRWRSGVVTRLDVKRVQRGEWSLKTPVQAVARIHELAADLSYAQIAEELNATGWRTAGCRVPLPASTWAIFVDGIAAGAKGLVRWGTLVKPGDGRIAG